MKETAEYSTIACEDKNPQSKRREEYTEGNKKWRKVQVNLEPIPYFQRMKIVFPSCGSTACLQSDRTEVFCFSMPHFFLLYSIPPSFPQNIPVSQKGSFSWSPVPDHLVSVALLATLLHENSPPCCLISLGTSLSMIHSCFVPYLCLLKSN